MPRLRSLPGLMQRNLPLLSGVLLSVPPNGVGDFEVVMYYAPIGGFVADIWKLLRWRFADWTNEGH